LPALSREPDIRLPTRTEFIDFILERFRAWHGIEDRRSELARVVFCNAQRSLKHAVFVPPAAMRRLKARIGELADIEDRRLGVR
jgi:hypothetical protein